jgi:sigma-B regulation protein RsbU (phosphoserine phosphatase)
MKKKQSSDNLRDSKRIGIFLGEVSQYSDVIWQGIVDSARDLQVNTISLMGRELARNVNSRFTDNIIYQLANQNSLDGLIILTSGLSSWVSQAEIEAFSHRYQALLPTVSIGEKIEGVPSLTIDNGTGLRDLLSHLIHEHGYRKIAFMKGPQDNSDAQDRYQAYQETLAAENIPLDPNLVVQGGFVTLTGQTATEELLHRGVSFEVLIAANDWTAWAAAEVFKAHGLNIPDDIAVVGFDDSVDSQYFMPPLSTVKQPRYELGQQAIQML